MNRAPFDMLRYFGITEYEEDELKVIQVSGGDDKWLDAYFFPDATLLVVVYTKYGIKKIAVKYEERVTEFDLESILVRDGELVGIDRNS